MDGGKVKKPPCGGYSPPISKNKFLFFYQISKWNFFIFDFYFCRLLPWRVPFRSWFRSRFFGRCLPQLPRSSLSSAAASLSLILPGFFYCVLVRCCRFYALMLAIICLLLLGLPLGLLVPSWGVLAPGVYLLPWAYISRGLLLPGGFSLHSLQLHCSPISNAAPHRGHIL